MMNERIKNLAEQAGLKYHNWITNESNIDDGDFKYPRLEDYEKFVELIVQECCDVLQGEDIRYGGYGYNQGFLHKKIKEHFGVEE